MRVLISIAAKSLLHNRLVLALLLTAVAAGVAFQIPTAAHLDGYSDELVRAVIGREFGHVLVRPAGLEPFSDADELARKVAAEPYVRGVTVRMVHAGAIARQGEHEPVRVVGLDMAHEEEVTGFCAQLSSGACPLPDDLDALVLGSQQAMQLGVKAGDLVKLAMPYRDRGDVDVRLKFSSRDHRVSGILSGAGRWQADFDVYVPLATLRRLFNDAGLGNRIAVFVDARERSGEYAESLQERVAPARAQPWWDVHSFVKHATAGNRRLGALSMVMVLVAVGVPVLALLYINALRERRHIAVLAAIGFDRTSVFRIYLLKAAVVGVVGAIAGLLIAVAVCLLLSHWPVYDYEGFVVRPVLSTKTLVVPAAGVCATCLVAGIFPAWVAARQNTAEVLRDL